MANRWPIIKKLNTSKKAKQKLSQELGRIPAVSELAKELRLEPQQVRQCLEWMQKPQSLNLCIGLKEDTELGDLLEDTNPKPSETFMHSCLKANIESLMAFLTPQQREVLTLRFELVDGHELSLTQVGVRLNLSRERVRQVEKVALMQLRKNERLLLDYM